MHSGKCSGRKRTGLPVDTTRDLVLKLAEQEEGKLYLTEAEHSKSVEALNQLRDTYLKTDAIPMGSTASC